MRPQYTPNQYGTYNIQDALEVIDSLEAGGESAVYIALLIDQVERLLKEKNTASLDKKNIGPHQVKEVIAAMIASGYWEPK